jgi:hypothetical protein
MPIRSLSWLALVFVLLFGLQLLAVLLPFSPLDPAWQWRLTTGLINGAPLPLLALALLLIAEILDPDDPLLNQRRRLFSRLAVAASLGFLLLLPLQLSAGLRQQNVVADAQRSRISGGERRLAALRQAAASATSNANLNASLQKLHGQVLGPADLAQPLPLLKAQVNAVFEQAQIQINRDRAALPPASATAALPELLRNSLACLILAGAFGAFAHRPGSDLSLLEEGQARLQGLRWQRPGRSRARAEADYLREMVGEDE